MIERVRSTRHRKLTLLDAVADPHIFQPWFRDPTSWAAWFAFLAALFALPMTADQLAAYRQCTGRDEAPTEVAKEGWLVCGRRAGKSFILALVAVWLACFRDYRQYLSPGERGTVLVVAADRKQARVILRYVRALLTRIPMLAQTVEREWAEGFDLSNSVSIEIATASFRTTRGYTIISALLDELAFFANEDAAEPDYEVLNALRPGMATIPGAMLLCASSPYARRGELWNAHRRHFGRDGDPILIWQAATRVMNPMVPQSVIDDAMEADPVSAAAEYLAQFRSDIESFISREAVEAVIVPDRHELARMDGVTYRAFTDPSGGRSDAFTLAIGHKEGDRVVLDVLRELRPPFSPESAVEEFADTLTSYGIRKVVGDKYAGLWPVEVFHRHGITYDQAASPKNDLYRGLLPAINSGKVELLDHGRLVAQMCALERRTARGGRDSVDHPPGGHDDLANVLAGVVSLLAASKGRYVADMSWVSDDLDAGAAYLDRMLGRMH